MNKKEIKDKFNSLREKYGELLIRLKRNKIHSDKWSEYIFKEFKEEEISFIFGQNIWRFSEKDNDEVNLGKGTKAIISKGSSRLLISPEKAGILTWICCDGYMSTHSGGHYINIRDDDIIVFNYFKRIVEEVYGKVNFQIAKIKDKNAYQCLFCSKETFRDILTYIPLSSTREWSIPIELLNEKAKIEVLRILTHAEGTVFKTNRSRAIEVTLANLTTLIQAQSLFEEFEIPSKLRKDFSGGWKRYKIRIGRRENLEKFRKLIHFIPNTKKYDKFENILKGYKVYSNQDCREKLLESIRKREISKTKDFGKLLKFYSVTISKNLGMLKKEGLIDYNKGIGNSRHWFNKF